MFLVLHADGAQFTRHFKPKASVYDCMDELSAFKGASTLLPQLKRNYSDVLISCLPAVRVFTKRNAINIAPSTRFRAASTLHTSEKHATPTRSSDQANIPHPRLGFFGVIDERFDRELLDQVASRRPDWNFVIVDPSSRSIRKRCRSTQTFTISVPRSTTNCRVSRWLGHRAPPLCTQRFNAFHQSDQDAGVFSSRQARHFHFDPRRRPSYGEMKLVEIADTPDEFIYAAENTPFAIERCGVARESRCVSGEHLVGQDLETDVGS
jgi:UDP-galactopyranose mutase